MTKSQIKEKTRNDVVNAIYLFLVHKNGGIRKVKEETGIAQVHETAWFFANRLHAVETSLHRLAEIECDHGLTRRQEMNQEKLERRAMKLARNGIGCKVEIGGDPRGCIIKLKLKKKYTKNFYNSWDGESTVMDW